MINGELIKQKRLERGLSQQELAILCGYNDKSAICKIETGCVEDIPLTKAIKMAQILKVKPTELTE